MNLTSMQQQQQPLIGQLNVTFASVHNSNSSSSVVDNQLFVNNDNISQINETIELSERNNNSVCIEKKKFKDGDLTATQIFFICLGVCFFVLACMLGGVPI